MSRVLRESLLVAITAVLLTGCEGSVDFCKNVSCNHGTCEVAHGMASCKCAAGYQGTLCDTCAPGHKKGADGACTYFGGCTVENACQHAGTCDDSSGSVVCTCPTGYSGAHCESCAAAFHDDGTAHCVADATCLANTCSGHGACTPSGATPTCACEPGYDGAHCEGCADGFHRDPGDGCVADEVCAEDSCGHGACTVSNGVIACGCERGWAGARCDGCAPGFHSDEAGACALDQQCFLSTCSGHGACTATGVVVACECANGYDGAYCEKCDAGFHRDPLGLCELNEPCAPDLCNHGSCNNATGVAACSCDAGYGGTRCELCALGYHLEGGLCERDEVCQAGACSGHGTCTTPGGKLQCACEVGYTGAACSDCYPGYERSPLNQKCQLPCSGPEWIRCDGTCVDGYAHDTCGDCGATCAPAELCQRAPATGEASCICPVDENHAVCPGGTCADSRLDENNCGACGNVCDFGDKCIDGSCQANDPSCSAIGSCTGEEDVCCDGVCLPGAAWNAENCGGCGLACGEAEACQVVGNSAQCVCPLGDLYRRDCPGDSCVNVFEDELNCGACGTRCNAGESCVLGTCRIEDPSCSDCQEGTFCCSGQCRDITSFRSDEHNCGGCGIVCTEGVCSGGKCVLGDPQGGCMMWTPSDHTICCDRLPAGTDPSWDSSNCGGCGHRCVQGLCVDGVCQCTDSVCGDECVRLLWNPQHCGSCGNVCDVAAGQQCVMGRCADAG